MDVERIIDDIQQLEEISKRRISGHSAKTTSPLRISGTMRSSPIVRGSGTEFVADRKLPNSD